MQVARIRVLDARQGDIICRDPDYTREWFQLRQVDQLHDGKVNLSDGGVENSFAVNPLDIIGLQLIKTAKIEDQPELPDFGAAGPELAPLEAEDSTEEAAAEAPVGAGHGAPVHAA